MTTELSAGLHTVGRSVDRYDGVGFVTGRTQYASDLSFPRMLHLKVVRSPSHHARIRGVDLSEAEKVPGFVRALTHADVPHNVYTILGLIGVEPEEEYVLPVDRVRYKGEPLVAILAESEAAAYEAVAKVRLDLEELPAVFDMDEALAPGAPVVTHWGNNTFMYEGHECRRVRYGDVEAGFAHADHIVEGEYRTSPIEHAPIETTGCIAVPEANGRFTVHTNTQAIYFSLDNTSIILQLPANRLRFIGGMVGGGFGGKVDVIVEPLATLGAMHTGRPVRYVYSRSEEMQVSSTRSAEIIRIKDGVMADGHDRRPQGDRHGGLRRLQPPDALRDHQVRRQRDRAVPHPQRLGRRLLRLHQPHADLGDARVRRDDGPLRASRSRWTRSRGCSISTRGPCGSGTPTATATSSHTASRPRTRRSSRRCRRRPSWSGLELAPELKAMTSRPARRAGRRPLADGHAARDRAWPPSTTPPA